MFSFFVFVYVLYIYSMICHMHDMSWNKEIEHIHKEICSLIPIKNIYVTCMMSAIPIKTIYVPKFTPIY